MPVVCAQALRSPLPPTPPLTPPHGRAAEAAEAAEEECAALRRREAELRAAAAEACRKTEGDAAAREHFLAVQHHKEMSEQVGRQTDSSIHPSIHPSIPSIHRCTLCYCRFIGLNVSLSVSVCLPLSLSLLPTHPPSLPPSLPPNQPTNHPSLPREFSLPSISSSSLSPSCSSSSPSSPIPPTLTNRHRVSAPARLRYEDKDLKTRGHAFPLKFQCEGTNRHRVRANRHRARPPAPRPTTVFVADAAGARGLWAGKHAVREVPRPPSHGRVYDDDMLLLI